MTNAIIFHECATQVGLKNPWSKIPKSYKDKRFIVEIINKKIYVDEKKKINIQFQKNETKLNKLFDKIDLDSLELFREMMSTRFNKNYED